MYKFVHKIKGVGSVLLGMIVSFFMMGFGTVFAEGVVGDILKKYENVGDVRQILIIVTNSDKKEKVFLNKETAETKSTAAASFYTKGQDNAWKEIFANEVAYIGKNGAGKTKEGDGKTPLGVFNVLGAFGIKEKPVKVELPYINVTQTTYACSDDCEFYNKIVDLRKKGHDCKGERMFEHVPSYNYGLIIDFNSDKEPYAGSNIFIHCYGKHHFTEGCVALKEECILRMLRKAKSAQMLVSIV